MEVQRDPNRRKAYLLGGMNQVTALDAEERNKISNVVSLPLKEIPVAAFSSIRAFIANAGFNGCVVSSGDNVIENHLNMTNLYRVEGFLSLTCGKRNISFLLVYGVRYADDLHDGQVSRDCWSRFLKVKSQPLAEKLYSQI